MRTKIEKTVIVLNYKGNELPRTDYRKAKKLVKERKAEVICTTPYTIKLNIITA